MAPFGLALVNPGWGRRRRRLIAGDDSPSSDASGLNLDGADALLGNADSGSPHGQEEEEEEEETERQQANGAGARAGGGNLQVDCCRWFPAVGKLPLLLIVAVGDWRLP